MKILVTGGGGLLGPYLIEAFSAKYQVVAPSGVDLTKSLQCKQCILFNMPDVVIHAAAKTDIDSCEDDPIAALAVNREATANIVYSLNSLTENKAKLVYISTDMVYADIPGPHREDEARPVNMYGRSKVAGERSAAMNPRYLVLRTNFFGPSKTNGRQSFSDWVIQSLQDGSTPIFFNDVWWSPLHMRTLSQLIVGLVEADLIGTYNIGSRDGTTKADFAMKLAELKGLSVNNVSIGPSHYRIKRPHDLRMDCTRLEKSGWFMPTLEEELAKL